MYNEKLITKEKDRRVAKKKRKYVRPKYGMANVCLHHNSTETG